MLKMPDQTLYLVHVYVHVCILEGLRNPKIYRSTWLIDQKYLNQVSQCKQWHYSVVYLFQVPPYFVMLFLLKIFFWWLGAWYMFVCRSKHTIIAFIECGNWSISSVKWRVIWALSLQMIYSCLIMKNVDHCIEEWWISVSYSRVLAFKL